MAVDDRNRLWVAGGPIGTGYVFDADTGGVPIETFGFADPHVAGTFVNDVVVTNDAAFFTDSFRPVLYRVPIGPGGNIGDVEVMPLDQLAIGFSDGNFNLNGIAATPSGDTLIVVNTTTGSPFAVDPHTGDVRDHPRRRDVAFGDGILLHGRTLYVVQNRLNRIAVVELSPDLSSGGIVRHFGNDELGRFDMPTTIARFGSSLYAVDARFRPPDAPQPEDFWITRLER